MNTEMIGLVLDGLVLVFLAATIFVAWKLSDSINVFRKTRKDMDKILQDLSRNIDKAELSITGLKSATRDAGRDLQSIVAEARALSDELQLMNDSGDNLASRLERLAERNRDIAERLEKAGGASVGIPTRTPSIQRAQEDKRAAIGPSFAIRDREAESGRGVAEDEDETLDPDDFSTPAERELMLALKKGMSKKSGGLT